LGDVKLRLSLHSLSQTDKRFSVSVSGNEPSTGRQALGGSDLNDTRMAVYRVYDIFSRIQARLKKTKFSDDEIVEKISSGQFLSSDDRFAGFRKRKRDDFGHSVLLQKSDEEWLKATYFAEFIQAEAHLLPQLRDEVRDRVCARKKGAFELFS
jgi:hypothetical protein